MEIKVFHNNSGSLAEAKTGSPMQIRGSVHSDSTVLWGHKRQTGDVRKMVFTTWMTDFSKMSHPFGVGHLTETHDPAQGEISQGILFSLSWSLSTGLTEHPYSEPCLRRHVKWFVLANHTFSLFLLHTSPSLQLDPRNLRLLTASGKNFSPRNVGYFEPIRTVMPCKSIYWTKMC